MPERCPDLRLVDNPDEAPRRTPRDPTRQRKIVPMDLCPQRASVDNPSPVPPPRRARLLDLASEKPGDAAA